MTLRKDIIGLAGICAVAGIALLVCSSTVVYSNVTGFQNCNETNSTSREASCVFIRNWIAAGSVGIIASALQIGSFSLAVMDKPLLWSGAQIVVSILCATSFGIGVTHFGFDDRTSSKFKAFTALALIDAVSSLVDPIILGLL